MLEGKKTIQVVAALVLTVIVALFVGCSDSGGGGSASSSGGSADAGPSTGSTSSSGSTTTSSSGASTSSSGTSGTSGSSSGDGGTATQPEIVLEVNQLSIRLSALIGKKVWLHGFYGDTRHNADGMGFVVDNVRRLTVDEAFPQHTMARLAGTLPPATAERAEIMVYGVVSDFATTTGRYALHPTPLVTVTEFQTVADAVASTTWDPPLLLDPPGADSAEARLVGAGRSFEPRELTPFVPIRKIPNVVPRTARPDAVGGTKATACDRSVIISGGVDDSNNHERYRDNLKAKVSKMRELGYTDDHIEVFYNDGGAIDLNGTNITDEKSDKDKIKQHFADLAVDMTGSCTLTIFVTDHGTGYNAGQGYEGARPALSGPEATGGVQYPESTFKLDARRYHWRFVQFRDRSGNLYRIFKNKAGKSLVYKRVVSGTPPTASWELRGHDANGDGKYQDNEIGDINNDGFIGETEIDADLNGDGDSTDATFGFSLSALDGAGVTDTPTDAVWDTDKDGTPDMRYHWDGTRYVAERFVGGAWTEIGRDTNGDDIIDGADGGVDWNLDGNKTGSVGFHEGINLWGDKVLWDDELTNMLKPLSDKGVHIMIEMVSCFSGGFVPNLTNIVENIVTGAPEDDKDWSRYVGDKIVAVNEIEFLNHLDGIDTASWSKAWDAAIAADDATVGTPGNDVKNKPTRWETPQITTTTKFQAVGTDGTYNVQLNIPAALAGKVYDFELIFGLQQPRWLWGGFPDGLPAGYNDELIGGGIRVYTATPIPDGFKIKVKGSPGSEQIRIGYTDVNHKSLGYTLAQPGTVTIQKQIHVSAMTIGFQHFTGYSEVQGTVTIVDQNGLPLGGVSVTLNMPGGDPLVTKTFTTSSSGVASYVFRITSYGTYTVTVTNVSEPTSFYASAQNVVSSKTVIVN